MNSEQTEFRFSLPLNHAHKSLYQQFCDNIQTLYANPSSCQGPAHTFALCYNCHLPAYNNKMLFPYRVWCLRLVHTFHPVCTHILLPNSIPRLFCIPYVHNRHLQPNKQTSLLFSSRYPSTYPTLLGCHS